MNSGTLVGSLIFAAVLVVVIALVIQLMMRGWRDRAQRQAELIGALPEMPDQVGSATITTRGHYCGCTLAPSWNERVAVGDLGYRSKAVLTRYPEGILLERSPRQPDLDSAGVDYGDPHRTRHRRQGRWPATGYWRSAGGCRRASRSTPGFAARTATNTPTGSTAGRRPRE